jgi:conjugative relaxase-like TrwC/TraI family protein
MRDVPTVRTSRPFVDEPSGIVVKTCRCPSDREEARQVLGVHRLSSKGADYYLSDLATELPLPARWQEGRAEWVGQAAEGLGLRGPVDPTHLRAVLGGRHPTTGGPLRSERATVPGFDLTFSVPKSVSVLFGLGGEEAARQVLAAHREGVSGALRYVEAHALSARRGSGEGRELVPTTGMVAASFTHGVNRNLDPHLHTHVVMANAVHGQDSRWGACDHRGLSAHARAASAVYDAHVRAELTARLGVGWVVAPGLRAEVAGVSPLLLGEFSSRAADIRRHMADWGSHSARGARVAWSATRAEKGPGVTFHELAAEWGRRARSVEGPPLTEMDLPGRRGSAGERRTLDEHRFGAVLSLAPDGAARRRDVVTAFGTAAVGGAGAQSVERLAELWVSSGGQVGVAEQAHPLRSVVPSGYQLRALGPRPVDPAGHQVWRDAAGAIDTYRRRWSVTTPGDALGADALPQGLASLPAARLVDHLRTARQIESARLRLGWRERRALEMDRGR